MNWLVLMIAGFCECGFTFCLGNAKNAVGFRYVLWIVGFLVFTFLSMFLLMKATRTLPIGTAYTVWTGIGAMGTVLLGVIFFHEPVTFGRIFFMTTLIVSIVGLKVVS